MGAYALIIVTCLYLVTAWDFASKGNWPLAIAFASYSAANLGFIWAALRT